MWLWSNGLSYNNEIYVKYDEKPIGYSKKFRRTQDTSSTSTSFNVNGTRETGMSCVATLIFLFFQTNSNDRKSYILSSNNYSDDNEEHETEDIGIESEPLNETGIVCLPFEMCIACGYYWYFQHVLYYI